MSRLRICFHENPAFPWDAGSYATALIPPHVDFGSGEQLKAAADAEGLAMVVYSGYESLFPDCKPQHSALTGNLEEAVYALADELVGTPEEHFEQWPAKYPLLRYLAYWRPALLEEGAYLSLSSIH